MTGPGMFSSGGTVTVAGRTFQVQKLSLQGEYALRGVLADLAKKEFGPGGYFAKAAGALDWLKQTNRAAEFANAVQHVTAMEAGGVPVNDDVIEQFRQSPAGVAAELYHRTRKTHPEVGHDDIAAIVTRMNAVETYLAVIEALTDAGKSPTPFSSPPT